MSLVRLHNVGGVFRDLSQTIACRFPRPTIRSLMTQSSSGNGDLARNHLDQVKRNLGKVDPSLSALAADFVPEESSSRKRKSETGPNSASKRKAQKPLVKKSIEDMTVSERQDQAMEDLAVYIKSVGGKDGS